MPSQDCTKMQSYLEWISNVPNLFIPGAKLTTRKTQETSKCSHYIPIISWFYPHHAYHPTIFVGYIPIVHGSMTNPTLPLHRRLGPNGGGGGGACPWCCTASGNSPWFSPQSANQQWLPDVNPQILDAPRFWRIVAMNRFSCWENNRCWSPNGI